jgi:hypothetical protein
MSSNISDQDLNLQTLVENQAVQLRDLKKDFNNLLKKYQKIKSRVTKLENDRCDHCRRSRAIDYSQDEDQIGNSKVLANQQLFGRARSGYIVTPTPAVDFFESKFYGIHRKPSAEKSLILNERTFANITTFKTKAIDASRANFKLDHSSPGHFPPKPKTTKLAEQVSKMVSMDCSYVKNLDHKVRPVKATAVNSFAEKVDQICVNNKLNAMKLQKISQYQNLNMRRVSDFKNNGACSGVSQDIKYVI